MLSYDEIVLNIRHLVKESGMKQKAIAEKIKVTENEFSAMLNNRKVIKAEYIPLIALALHVTPNDLLLFDNNQNRAS